MHKDLNLLLKLKAKINSNSDHRPVLCVLDLDAVRVDAERRGRVFEEVVKSVGPTDGSVMLKAASLSSAEAPSESVLAEFLSQKFGPVRFVKRLRDLIWVGFANNAVALDAAAAGRIQVRGNDYQGTIEGNYIRSV